MSDPKQKLMELLTPVVNGLERMRGVLASELHEPSPVVQDMIDHVGRFQGKQLRGGMVLLMGEATGNSTDEHPTIAAIVEMIHMATLVHDDILDGAEVRRRVACLNQRWNNQVAVLLGDYLYSRAFALSTHLSSRLTSRLLADTTRTICVGEIEQSALRYDFDLTQESYERIAGAKTGSLYAAACELGARYPGGNEVLGGQMRKFGYEIGLAFQIVDDCLDLAGDAKVVGKSVGTDVEDGKVTLPVLHVYSASSEAERAAIRDVFTLPDLEQRTLKLRDVCDLDAGIERSMDYAQELVERARTRLQSLPASPAVDALHVLGDFVLKRKW